MECELLKQEIGKEKKYEHADYIDIYLDQIKKVTPFIINITVRYKEPGVEMLITKDEKFLSVEDVQICNTPRPYFFGYPPNPLH